MSEENTTNNVSGTVTAAPEDNLSLSIIKRPSEELVAEKQQHLQKARVLKEYLARPDRTPATVEEFNMLVSTYRPGAPFLENTPENQQQLDLQRSIYEKEDAIGSEEYLRNLDSREHGGMSISGQDIFLSLEDAELSGRAFINDQVTKRVQGLTDIVKEKGFAAGVSALSNQYAAGYLNLVDYLVPDALGGEEVKAKADELEKRANIERKESDFTKAEDIRISDRKAEIDEAFTERTKRTRNISSLRDELSELERPEKEAKRNAETKRWLEEISGGKVSAEAVDDINTVINAASNFKEAISNFNKTTGAVNNAISSEAGMLAVEVVTGTAMRRVATGLLTKKLAKSGGQMTAKDVAKLEGMGEKGAMASAVFQEASSAGYDAKATVLDLGAQEGAEDKFMTNPDYAAMRNKGISHEEAVNKIALEAGDTATLFAAISTVVGAKVSGSSKLFGNLLSVNPSIPDSIKRKAFLDAFNAGIAGKTYKALPLSTLTRGARGFGSEAIEESINTVGGTAGQNKALQAAGEDVETFQGLAYDMGRAFIEGGVVGGAVSSVGGIPTDIGKSGKIVSNAGKLGSEKIAEAATNTDPSKKNYSPVAGYNKVKQKGREAYESEEAYKENLQSHMKETVKMFDASAKELVKAHESGDRARISKAKAKHDELAGVTKELWDSYNKNEKATTDRTESEDLASALAPDDVLQNQEPLQAESYESDVVKKAVKAINEAKKLARTLVSRGKGKNAQEVRNDIIEGNDKKGFVGLNQYNSAIASAVALKDSSTAKEIFESLAAFSTKHKNKLVAAKSIVSLKSQIDSTKDANAKASLQNQLNTELATFTQQHGFEFDLNKNKESSANKEASISSSIAALGRVIPSIEQESKLIDKTAEANKYLIESIDANTPIIKASAPIETTEDDVTPTQETPVEDDEGPPWEVEETTATEKRDLKLETKAAEKTGKLRRVKLDGKNLAVLEDNTVVDSAYNEVAIDEDIKDTVLINAVPKGTATKSVKSADIRKATQITEKANKGKEVDNENTPPWEIEGTETAKAQAESGEVSDVASNSSIKVISKENINNISPVDILSNIEKIFPGIAKTQKLLANRLIQSLENVAPDLKVERISFKDDSRISEESKDAKGEFQPVDNKLYLNSDVEINEGEIFLHEMVHAVTSRLVYAYENGITDGMTERQIEGIKQVIADFETFNEWMAKNKDKLKGKEAYILNYANKNVYEFLAVSLTDPTAFNALKSIPSKTEKTSIAGSLLKAISKLLGFTDKTSVSLLASLLSGLDKITNIEEETKVVTPPQDLLFSGAIKRHFASRKPSGKLATREDTLRLFNDEKSELSEKENQFLGGMFRAAVDEFIVGYNTITQKVGTRQKESTILRNSPEYLLLSAVSDVDALKFDDAFTTKAALVSLKYLMTQGSTLIGATQDSINKHLRRDPDTFVSRELWQKYGDAGMPYIVVATSLGKQILAANGIFEKTDQPKEYYDSLAQSVGTRALSALNSINVLEFQYIEENVNGKDIEVMFVRMPFERIEGKKVIREDIRTFMGLGEDYIEKESKENSNFIKYLESLTSDEADYSYPLTEKPPKVSNKIKNSFLLAPKKQVKILTKYVNTPWSVDTKFNNIFGGLSLATKKAIIGVDEDLSKIPEASEDGKIESNAGKMQELEHFNNYSNYLSSLPTGLQTPFYIGGQIWRVGRMGMLGAINPQTSKIHRHLVKRADAVKTYDKSNTAQMNRFAIAVAEGLGVKVNKQSLADTLDTFDLLTTDPVFAKGLAVIKDMNEGIPLTTEMEMDLVAAVKQGDENAASLDALIALEAFQNSTDTFESSILREVDGINNGVFFNLITFGAGLNLQHLKDLLNKVGVFTGPKYKTYMEWKKDPNAKEPHLDFYEAVIADMQNILSEASPKLAALLDLSLKGSKILDENGNVTSEARNITKNPVMVAMYGAGEVSISEAVAAELYDLLLNELFTASADRKVAIASDLSIIFDEKISVEDLEHYSGRDVSLTPEYEKMFKSITKDILGSGIVTSLTAGSLLGVFMERRNAYSNVISRTAELFQELFTNAVKEERQKLGRGLSRQEMEGIFNKYLSGFPLLKSPYSDDIVEGLPLSGLTNTRAIQDNKGKMDLVTHAPFKILDGRTIKSKGHNIPKTTMEPTGAKAGPFGTQSQDGFAAGMTMNDHPSTLNVHDASLMSALDSTTVGLSLNKHAMDAAFDHDLFAEADRMLKGILTLANDPSVPLSISKADLEVLRTGLINPFQEQWDAANDLKQALKDDNSLRSMQYDGSLEDATYYYNGDNPLLETEADVEAELAKLISLATSAPTGTVNQELTIDSNDEVVRNVDGNLEKFTPVVDSEGLDVLYIKVLKGKKEIYSTDFELLAVVGNRKGNDGLTAEVEKQAGRLLGSTDPSRFNPDLFTNSQGMPVNSENIVDVFDSLENEGNIKEDPEHMEYLKGLLSTTLNEFIKPIKLNIAKHAKDGNEGFIQTADNEIYLQQGTGTDVLGVHASMQELFAHEVTHDVLAAGIDSDSKAAQELYQLWKAVKNSGLVTPESFLKMKNGVAVDYQGNPLIIGSDAYNAELEIATEKYDSIFNNTQRNEEISQASGAVHVSVRNPFLQEFGAFALTNASVKRAISRVNVKGAELKNELTGESLWDKLYNLYNRILERFFKNLNTSKPADQVLTDLALRLAKRQEYKENALWNSVNFLNNGSGDAISAWVVQPITKFLSDNYLTRNKVKVASNALELLSLLPTISREGFLKVMNEAVARLKKVENIILREATTFVVEGIQEIGGNEGKHRDIISLRRISKSLVDQARQTTAQAIAELVSAAYTRRLKKAERIGITKVLLNVDVASIVNTENQKEGAITYNLQRVGELLTSRAELKKEIDILLDYLKQEYPDHHIAYDNLSNSLGQFLVHNTVNQENSALNAHNIANLTTIKGLNPPADTVKAQQIVEALSTLYGLDMLYEGEANSLATVAELIKTQPDGVSVTLAQHTTLKNNAKARLFDSNDALMVKGHTKKLVNPNIDIKVLTEKEAKDEGLAFRGYKKGAEVPADKDFPSSEPKYFYTNKHGGGVNELQTGITSYTQNHSLGTDLQDIALEEDTPLGREIADMVTKEVMLKKSAQNKDINKRKGASTAKNIAIPTTDTTGKVVSYRQVMSRDTQRKLLDIDENFETILGSMAGSIHDKVESPEVNKIAVEKLKEEYDKEYNKEPYAYTNIGRYSSDPKGREIWSMLPSDTKAHIDKVWGRNGLYVHNSMQKEVFGERKFRLSNVTKMDIDELEGLNKAAGYINNLISLMFNNKIGIPLETYWQDFVKLAKDNIVIKSISVLAGNIVSNYISLMALGINPVTAHKDQMEGFFAARKYQKDSRELFNLLAQEENTPSLRNNKEHNNRKAIVENRLANSSVRELMEHGVYQSINEDIYMLESGGKFKGAIEDKIGEGLDYLGLGGEGSSKVGKVLKTAAFMHGTPIYDALRDMTQLSDFMARYALHKHNTRNGMELEDSINDVVETFIDYDSISNKYLQYGNDIGVVMFTKYWLRNQRIIAKIAKERPASALFLIAMNMSLDGGLSNIFQTTLFDGRGLNTPYDVVTGAITTHPLYYVYKMLFDLR